MPSVVKKLTIALKLKDWNKLSDGDRMVYAREFNNCSHGERDEINEMISLLNIYDYYKRK